LTKQKKEDENEKDLETKEMQTKYFTDILSSIDVAAEKLCDLDPDWERSSTLKRSTGAMLHPFYEILQEKKKKSKQLTLHSFLDVLNHGLGLLPQNTQQKPILYADIHTFLCASKL
jgi:hypothetical protein